MAENAQTIQIPDEYAVLGVRRGFNPSTPDELRMIVGGFYGTGKTSFVCGDPKALVMDFDNAAQDVYGCRALHVPVQSWGRYMALKALLLRDKEAGKCPVSRIVFDTGDLFLELIDHELVGPINARRTDAEGTPLAGEPAPIRSMKEFGQSGAGYTKLTQTMLGELLEWYNGGFAWTVTCQLKWEKAANGGAASDLRSQMAPTTFGMLSSYADLIAMIDVQLRTETPKIKQIVQGKPVLIDGPQRTIREVRLDAFATERPGQADPKCRLLGVEVRTVIPAIGGWAAFHKHYSEQRQKLVDQSRGVKPPAKVAVPPTPVPAVAVTADVTPPPPPAV